MKERLVEDWLIRINERGYEVPFCQNLASRGYRILRCGHSPVEHGKDVLAIAPNGDVYAYQLKSGDVSQADISKHHAQLVMLIETRPLHPGLPAEFNYRPVFVTTGEFKDPAISLIRELNEGWTHRGLPRLEIINGRQLHVDLLSLASDFWPTDVPAIRGFRELYLVNGSGDFEIDSFAKFIENLLKDANSSLELSRRAAAANIFASYLLGDFYKQHDHWSVFRGWIICASHIAHAGLSRGTDKVHWRGAFELAKQGALIALELLAQEVASVDAFRVADREIDEFTRVRNTTALAASACFVLCDNSRDNLVSSLAASTARVLADHIARGRLFFWGEGACSQFFTIIWFLEFVGQPRVAEAALSELMESVSIRNSRRSDSPYEDPYSGPDEVLIKMFKQLDRGEAKHPHSVHSYSLLPMIVLATRRNMRNRMQELWPTITKVQLTWFRHSTPEELLLWRCAHGKEEDATFDHTQSWKELQEFAWREDPGRLPSVIIEDRVFGLMFSLVYQHRLPPSFVKHLDSAFTAGAE